MTATIAIVDYCKGNLASVQRGLADAGFDARITDVPADILAADGVVLPGVGAFTDAMTTMEETGQADALRTAVADGVPALRLGRRGTARGEPPGGTGRLVRSRGAHGCN